jgi:hypothetical protein
MYSKTPVKKVCKFGMRLQLADTLSEILASLLFPQIFERQSNISKPHTNTCHWIINNDTYKEWKRDDNGILWIRGKAGAGKSTMMKFIHTLSEEEPLVSSNVNLNFFFNAQGAMLQKSCLGMTRSLLYQIYDKDPIACLQIKASYKRNRPAAGLEKEEVYWQLQELKNLFLDVLVSFCHQRAVTIFIDALDEAEAREIDDISEYVAEIDRQMRERHARVKICISCRHYSITDPSAKLMIKMEDRNAADITTYINDSLTLEYIGSSDHNAWQELKDELVQRALGVFRWARLVVPFVKRKIGEGDSLSEIREWLLNVPTELSDIYKHILLNVIAADRRPATFALLQWITLATWPLSLTELRHALAAQRLVAADVRKKCVEADGFIDSNDRMKRLVNTLSGGLAETLDRYQSRTRQRLREQALARPYRYEYHASYNVEVVELVHQGVAEYLKSDGLTLLTDLTNQMPGQSLARKSLDAKQTL